jgi:leader peptidase (prepilin peptidase)/N-methyltransferase
LIRILSLAAARAAHAALGQVARCRRRWRTLAPLSHDIFFWRNDGRVLAPAAWAAVISLIWLLVQWRDVGLYLVPSFILLPALCVIALFDARYFIIPDGPVLLLSMSGVVTSLASEPGSAPARLAAAVAGYLGLRLVAFGYEALRGAPGVGEGDARLYALAGLWLGFAGLPSSLIYGVFSALLSAAIALRLGALEDARQPIPFGPHLALGIWLVWVFGPLEAG